MTTRPAERQPAAPLVAIVLAAGLALPALLLWLLWITPIEGLASDRVALAARDFTDLWAAGRLATAHAFDVLYRPDELTAFLRQRFGADVPAQIWPYPPPALLLAAAVASMPLLPAFLAYTIAGLAALFCAARSRIASPKALAALLLSPAVAENALAGQNGALTASALAGGLFCLDSRPRLAGFLLGLLVLKPQLALMLPVCLVAGRRWRVLITALATGAAAIAASALLLGPDAWTGFVTTARPEIARYLEAPWIGAPSQRLFTSLFMGLRGLGASLAAAYAAQAALALIAAVLVWTAWRRPGASSGHRVALTLVASLAASPWTHGYDMPALAIAIALLLPAAQPRHLPFLAIAWVWPGTMSLLSLPVLLPSLSLLSMLMVASQLSLAIDAPNEGHRLRCA